MQQQNNRLVLSGDASQNSSQPQRTRYFSLYSQDFQPNLYYQQTSTKNATNPQTKQNSARKEKPSSQISYNRGLKSLQKERFKRKQNSIQILDQGTSQERQILAKSPNCKESNNNESEYDQTNHRLNFKRVNISFKEKRESLLRMKSLEREQLENKENNGIHSSLRSTSKLNNCQYKLKIFEQQWSLFKESLDQNNTEHIVQSQQKLSEHKKHHQFTHFGEKTQLIDSKQLLSDKRDDKNENQLNQSIKRQGRGEGIVSSFYRTRSQSPGFNLVSKSNTKEQNTLANAISFLNQSLRSTARKSNNEQFEKKVLKQIQDIQSSFFSTAQTPSRNIYDKQQCYSQQNTTNINQISILKHPSNMANYFTNTTNIAESIHNRHNLNEVQFSKRITNKCEQQQNTKAFQVRMNTNKDQEIKRQSSELSLHMTTSASQVSSSAQNSQRNNFESKDQHIQKVQRNFMNNCKKLSDMNSQFSSNQDGNGSSEQVQMVSSKVISNMKISGGLKSQKIKKIQQKIAFNEVDQNAQAVYTSSDKPSSHFKDSIKNEISSYNLRSTDSKSSLSQNKSQSRIQTPVNIIQNNKSPKLQIKKENVKSKSNRLSEQHKNGNRNKNQCLSSFALNKKTK